MNRNVRVPLVALVFVMTFGCEKSDSSTPGGADAAPPTDADEGAPQEEASSAPAEDAAEILSMSTFEEVVNENMQDVIDCYTEASEKNPKLAGKMQADFTFDGAGKVTGITVADGSTLTDDGLRACIETKAKNWTFPAAAAGEAMTLTFPFQLAPA